MLRLLACFFLFLQVPVFCQLPAQYHITSFTQADGLPEESANSVLQDSRGFLWIGTREALIRYDGQGRRTWYADPNNPTRFFNSNINVVGEYVTGKVLLLSGSDLWEVNIHNLHLQAIERFKGKKIVSKPVRAGNGDWIICTTDSIFITDTRLVPHYQFSKTSHFSWAGMVSAFPLAYPYILLFGGYNNNMGLFNLQDHRLIPIQLDDRMLDSRAKFLLPQAYDSSLKRLYLSAYFDGNFYIDNITPGITRYEPLKLLSQTDGAIRKSLLLSGGIMIQGGDNNLYLTDFRNTIVARKKETAETGGTLGIITDISRGLAGDFWIASTRGISRLSIEAPAVSYISRELGFSKDDEFKFIGKGSDDMIYLLAQEHSLNRLDTRNRQVRRLDSSLFYCWSAITHDRTVVATGGGRKLMEYDMSTGLIQYPQYLQPFYSENTDLVTLVFKARNGDTWYSCNGSAGLILQPSGTDQFIQYSRNQPTRKISIHYCHTAAEDSKGNIWFASNKSQYLLRWDAGKKKFEEMEVGNLIPAYSFSTGINHLYIDPADNLWISLDAAALLRYHLGTKTGDYYDINKGLPTNTVSSMTHDHKGRIWITTPRGLCCYLPETEKISVFTKKDGLPEEQLEGRGIYYDADENLLYIGGRRSISWFNPDQLLDLATSTRPAVYIDECRINQQPYYFQEGETISLRTFENNIEFSFSVPDFIRNNQLQFEYRLKGSGKQWVSLGNKRTVSFYNLPHGRYEFMVRCRYAESANWQELKIPVSFVIKTPWHKTWWFISLVIAGGILLFIMAIRFYYKRKMEKKQVIMEKEIAIEQERTKMARELHDGLGSMLSGIKHSFSAMNREFPLTELQQERFQLNLDKLNESIVELRNISHNMASDALLKFGLENSLRDYCSNSSLSSGIPVSFTALNTEQLPLAQEQSFHIFRILQELIQNIIKHAQAKQVLVQISYNNNMLYMTVEDDGIGFQLQEARKKTTLGLKNIETRVSLLKGQVDYKSAPGDGTSVMITIPVS